MRILMIDAINEPISAYIMTPLKTMCTFPLLDTHEISNTSNGFTVEVLNIISEQLIDEVMILEDAPLKKQLILNALSYNQRFTPISKPDRILITHNDKK